jgi:hypothetical protein
MKKTLLAAAALLLALPASATPVRLIVEPYEQMVVVPGLEILGPSRISTVKWCQKVEGVKDWRNLITDSDFDLMEACLIEHT